MPDEIFPAFYTLNLEDIMFVIEWGVVFFVGIIIVMYGLLEINTFLKDYNMWGATVSFPEAILTLALILSGIIVIHFAWVHRAMEITCTLYH